MIYTVTFNPSLDYIVSVDDFQLGLTNRTSSELLLPGGKGVNVSVILKNLGIESTALGFVAGFTGAEITRKMEEMGVRSDFIPVKEGISRINVKLKSIDGTEINGMGETSKILVGLILGGMMAIDMRGPFNKAAYVFGTASIAAGNYDIMAAVMIGGMTPSCAIALATLLFKNKFTKEQRDRADKLYYGTCIYHRRRHSIRGVRSAPCASVLYRGISGSRRVVYGVRMHADGSPRRNLRIPCSGKSADVSGSVGCRDADFHSSSRNAQKESGII